MISMPGEQDMNNSGKMRPGRFVLNRLNIRGKLLGTVMLVYIVSMGLASGLFLSYQWSVLKDQSLKDLRVLASITADNLTAALAFDDPRDAETVLGTLKRQPAVVRAGIFRTDGTYFASYYRDLESKGAISRPKERTYRFTRNGLEIFNDVVLDGEPIGHVYILSDLRQAKRVIIESAMGLLVVSIIGFFVAVALTAALQRSITRPLFHLSDVAGRVTKSRDFSIRADKHYNDEVGSLTDSFNLMLEQVAMGEAALRESELRFRTIFQSNPDSISICRLSDGAWLDVNEQFETVTGYKREEVLGKTGLEIDFWVSREDRDRMFDILIREGDISGFETDMRRKDGKIYTSLVSAVTIDLEGFPHLVSIMRDITDKKRSERQLQRYQDQLEQLVLERTKQLEEAQAELVRTERLSVLGQLTATVSHEIRNPLGTVRNAVFSMGDAFKKGEEKRIERALKLAERNIVRVDDIISELLYYTRKRELQKESTDLDAWLKHILQEQVMSEGVDLETDLVSGANLSMDREKMRRAFLNVFQNAQQAVLEKDGGAGKVKVFSSSAPEKVSISVTDTGIGIQPEELEQIFEPLFSTKSFGVGLGMPIVKNIVEEHKGTVEVVSKPGTGTTVTLNLPL